METLRNTAKAILEAYTVFRTALANYPITAPLARLLHSRKFTVTAVILAVDYLIAINPELEHVRLELIVSANILGLWLVGKIAGENSVGQPDESWARLVVEMAGKIRDLERELGIIGTGALNPTRRAPTPTPPPQDIPPPTSNLPGNPTR